MKSENKKKLIAEYKEKTIVGGVFAIKNNINGKMLIEPSLNLEGHRNRFIFSQSNNSPASFKIKRDFETFGGQNFSFEVLEEVKKGELQTDNEYEADIKLLTEMWREKYSSEELY